MADSNKSFYVTSVSNGHVLANQPSSRPSGVVAANCGDKGDDEKWIIEAGDKPNVVALKNASNGQYLRAEGGKNGSKAGTGDKQWWMISKDRVLAPGACSLSPVDYPNVFLNHFQGRAVPKGHVGMTVHMWQWEESYPQWFSWYMFDTDVSFNPLTSVADGKETKQPDTKQADFDTKLKALKERDNALAEKEQTRSTEWDEKMKDLQDRQAKSVRDEEERTASYDRKLKDLQDREAALSRQEEEAKSSKEEISENPKPDDREAQAQKEADIQRRLDDLSCAEQKLAVDRAALQKSQSDLQKKEKDIAQLQKDLEDSKLSEASSSFANDSTTSDNNAEQRLEKRQKDNASLEQRLAKLEDQLSKMTGPSEKPPDGKAQTNGKATIPKPSKIDTSSPSCGYKHYKPPRKLNRKLIGMIYE